MTTFEVGFKWSGAGVYSASCFVFNKAGKLCDIVNEKQVQSESKSIRFLKDSDKTFAYNQEQIKTPFNSSSGNNAASKTLPANTKLIVFHFQSDLEIDASSLLFVLENVAPVKNDPAPETFVLRHSMQSFDEDDTGMLECLTFQKLANFENIPSDQIVDKPRQVSTTTKFTAAYALERTKTAQKEVWLAKFKDFPLGHEEHVTGVPSQLYSQVGDSKPGDLADLQLRKGHSLYLTAKHLQLCFGWSVVGRKFNIDLAAIVYNKGGYIIDYIIHDKLQTFDGNVKRIADDGLKSIKLPFQLKDVSQAKRHEIIDVYQTETQDWHSIVFVTSIYTKNMSYLRVKDSSLSIFDGESGAKFASHKMSDSFETCQLWAKLTRANKGFILDIIDEPSVGSSYTSVLPTVREKYLPFNPSAYNCPVLSKPTNLGSKLIIRYRNAEFSDERNQPKNITLFFFDKKAFMVDKKELVFPKKPEFSALEPETSFLFQNSPGEVAFAVMTGSFKQQNKSSLIFLDNDTHSEIGQIYIGDDTTQLDGTERHFLAFRMDKVNSEWNINPLIKQFLKEGAMESWVFDIRKQFLNSWLNNRPQVSTLKDTWVFNESKDKDIIVGISVKGKPNSIKLKGFVYDSLHNKLAKVSKRNPKFSGMVNGTEKTIASWAAGNEMFILGEQNDMQIKMTMFADPHKHIHLAFTAKARSKGAFESKDVLLVRVYDAATVQELFQYEVPCGNVDRWCLGHVSRELKGQDALKYSFMYNVTKGQKEPQAGYLPKKPSYIILHAKRGKGLVSRDLNGKSDPYLKFKIPSIKAKAKTPTMMKTLDPEWNSDVKLAFPDKDTEINLEVWDWDALNKNDPMGAVYLQLSDIVPKLEYKTKVGPMKGDEKNTSDVTGHIEFSFSFA